MNLKPMSTRIALARQAGRVNRYHGRDLIKQEKVSDHTFNVLNLLFILTNGQVSQRLVTGALFHDMGEYATGDLPSPTKRALPTETRELLEGMEALAVAKIHYWYAEDMTENERFLLKIADNLDGLIKSMEEYHMGNNLMRDCCDNYANYLDDTIRGREHDQVFMIVTEYVTNWRKLGGPRT